MPNARNGGEANCPVCEQPFVKYRANHIYCSTPCREKVNHAKPAQVEKRSERHKQWSSDNKERRRDYHYRRIFGITLEQYEELLAAQNGVCAICHKPPKEGAKAHAVDHDHKTLEIFGILCNHCNYRLVGKIRDPVLFERAAEYLRQGKGLFVPPKKKRRRKPRKAKRIGKTT